MSGLWSKDNNGINQPPFLSAHHTVCVLGKPLQREQRVVWLHDNVTHLILVWENRVSLYQLLRVPEEKKICIIHTLCVTRRMEMNKSSVFADLSLSLSSRYDPSPEPVPPAIEWHKTNPYKDKELHITSKLQPVPHVRKAYCKLYWCGKLNVCGWANASLPRPLYKWECSPTSQIGSLTPKDSPVIPAFYARPAIITRHTTHHTLPTYTCPRQPGPPSYPTHTWVHTLNNNVGS